MALESRGLQNGLKGMKHEARLAKPPRTEREKARAAATFGQGAREHAFSDRAEIIPTRSSAHTAGVDPAVKEDEDALGIHALTDALYLPPKARGDARAQ